MIYAVKRRINYGTISDKKVYMQYVHLYVIQIIFLYQEVFYILMSNRVIYINYNGIESSIFSCYIIYCITVFFLINILYHVSYIIFNLLLVSQWSAEWSNQFHSLMLYISQFFILNSCIIVV